MIEHSSGAFAAFISCNILAIMLGKMHRRLGLSRGTGRGLMIVGVIGLISLVLYFSLIVSAVGDGGETIGIIGLIERGGAHPFLIGVLCAGASILKRRTPVLASTPMPH